MPKAWKALSLLILTINSFIFADVFMTELTDPQNSSDAGRYVELHNNGDSDVDLSSGWMLQRWTNGNTDPQAAVSLTGTISAGGFYVICTDADKHLAVYGTDCTQDIGTGGPADSNGDDNMALLDASGAVVDMFGVPGEDGSGTGHEFEDGRAERAGGVIAGNPTWDASEWNVDNDSGGGDGPVYAPEGFDPNAWIGTGDAPSDVYGCTDLFGLNYNSEATADDGSCNYADHQVEAGSMYFAPSDLVVNLGESVQWNNVGGNHDVVSSDGSFSFDACSGPCLIGSHTFDTAGTFDYICSVYGHEDMGMVGTVTVLGPDPAANLFFSEHAEGSSNNKYFEVYNASDATVDLSTYAFVNCSNGCTDWEYTTSFADGATVDAGSTYTVCHGSSDENGIIPFCNETRTLYHNGDDAQGLMHVATGTLLDVVGMIGDDPGSGWEVAGVANGTKDHTLVRKASVSSGNTDWTMSAGTNSDDSEWVVLDQNTWDYIGSHPHDFSSGGCTDPDACNYDPDASSDDGSCLYTDCLGECGGEAVCEVAVTFTVDMAVQGVTGDVNFRTSTENGDYMPSDWFPMDDSDGDMVYEITMMLETGVLYGYNFNDGGYESGSNLGDCAGGNYGNDRTVTPGDSDMVLDTVCWESCSACPDDIPGCTDPEALNFDPNATVDDGSCVYEGDETDNLFFSECAEGSSNNKYLEIYNAGDSDVDLSTYSLSSCSNGCNETDVWDYADNVTFDAGTMLSAGDVYVVCHGSADEIIQAECDQTFTYLSNGDDVFALTQVGTGTILDIIGTTGDDPGSGWEVAGVSNATKDHTLVRKASVSSGNTDWALSAGTNADDSEWMVYDQNTWDYVGSHPHAEAILGCMDSNATNYNPDATEQEYNEYGTSTCTYDSCEDIPVAQACLFDDGTSSTWNDGWWNCLDWGGSVCGLSEVVFELNLPDGVIGTPHVNGSYNGWCGSCYNNMTDDDGDGTWSHVQYFGEGETHDYKFTINGWDDQENLEGLDCAVETDGYWNRQFTTDGPNTSQTQTYCWGTCNETCDTESSCGDGVCDENEDCSSCPGDCGECEVYDVTFAIDGVDDCGFVSITGTFDNWSGWGANVDNGYTASMSNGDYEFVILCVNTDGEWWNDIWANSTVYNAPIDGDCWNGNYDYPNYVFSVSGSDMTVSYCAGTCDETCGGGNDFCQSGDSNLDGDLNVLDVVVAVEIIFGADGYGDDNVCATDTNGDGSVDVLDIVLTVEMILGGRGVEADKTEIIINGSEVMFNANGSVGAFQITLRHNNAFELELTDNALVSDYRTTDNSTTLIIVAPESDHLFSSNDYYVIEDVLAATTNGYIDVEMDLPLSYSISSAYPNPFNPSTTISIDLNTEANVSISVYNTMGQLMDVLVNDNLNAGSYPFAWNAQDAPSGLYFIKTNINSNMSTQKILLLK